MNEISPVKLESTEITAWQELVSLAPKAYREKTGLELRRLGNIVCILCPTIRFGHFNCVMGLGLEDEATEDMLEHIAAEYRAVGIKEFVVFWIPAAGQVVEEWLERRALRKAGWERIYRTGEPLQEIQPLPDGWRLERVTPESAEPWADFIDATYRMTTKPWLLEMVKEARYHHYALWQDNRIVAVRSMLINPDGTAWLGIDAPVPGIMADSYALDFQLVQRIVQDGLGEGVKLFVADIEAPSPTKDTPAYRDFAALGFKIPYFRRNYILGAR